MSALKTIILGAEELSPAALQHWCMKAGVNESVPTMRFDAIDPLRRPLAELRKLLPKGTRVLRARGCPGTRRGGYETIVTL